ncbi:hypothetical protein RQP46_001410 [Phenoliferia psychrophenolica]
MAPLAFHTVDAFTSTPFSGNPAAVLILLSSSSLADTKLQSIAAEFNLSETAFACPIPPPPLLLLLQQEKVTSPSAGSRLPLK